MVVLNCGALTLLYSQAVFLFRIIITTIIQIMSVQLLTLTIIRLVLRQAGWQSDKILVDLKSPMGHIIRIFMVFNEGTMLL